MQELEFIEFKLNSRIFEGFEFIVNGIDEANPIQNQQLFKSNSLDQLLVMSPFLSKDVIKDFNNRKNPKSKAVLITRPNSLGQLNSEKLDNFEFYVLKDEVIDGESLLSEDSYQLQDIHAKMYVVEKRAYTDLYLGSLNASHNALYGNVEFMIKLWATKGRVNVNKILKELFNDGKDNPFQSIDIKDIKLPPEGNNLNLVVKNIVRLNADAKVISNDEKYDLEVKFSSDCGNYDIYIKPLLSNKTEKFAKKVTFESLDKNQLSEFFVIIIHDDEETLRRVVKIPVENLPQDRQKEVVSNIVNDKTAFIRYVAFLLGDDYILSSIDEEGDGEGGIDNSFTIQLPELYEKMLKASMYAPEKFIELEYLIKTLSDDVIPEGFEELYNTFKEVIDNE